MQFTDLSYLTRPDLTLPDPTVTFKLMTLPDPIQLYLILR